jgi:hypothetical protein
MQLSFVLSLFLLAGCNSTRHVRFVRLDDGSNAKFPFAGNITILNGGKQVGVLNRDHPAFDLKVTGDTKRNSMGDPALNLVVDTPCDPKHTVMSHVESQGSDLLVTQIYPTDFLHFWYDNRNHGATKVQVGQALFTLAPNQAGQIAVIFAGCSGSADVMVDGEKAGSIDLDQQPRMSRGGPSDDVYVLDPSAAHCYVAGITRYGRPGTTDSDPVPVSTYGGKKLYAAPGTYDTFLFLESAPEKLQSYTGFNERASWVEIACSKK